LSAAHSALNFIIWIHGLYLDSNVQRPMRIWTPCAASKIMDRVFMFFNPPLHEPSFTPSLPSHIPQADSSPPFSHSTSPSLPHSYPYPDCTAQSALNTFVALVHIVRIALLAGFAIACLLGIVICCRECASVRSMVSRAFGGLSVRERCWWGWGVRAIYDGRGSGFGGLVAPCWCL
jgi:hypothetical protein